MSEEWLQTETRLRRSRKGDTIHAKDCRRAGNTVPWLWAEDKSLGELLVACKDNGLKRCRVCDALWENDSRTHVAPVAADLDSRLAGR